MKKITTGTLTRMALLAAVYATLTLFLAPISYGPFQLRISEALTVLPFFFPEAVFGLFVGCLLANIIGTFMGVSLGMLDIIFGSLATLLAAYLTMKIGKARLSDPASANKRMWLAPLPPVIVNAIVIGAVLTYVFAPETGIAGFAIFAAEVGVGQIAACYGLGVPLMFGIKKLAPRLIGN